MRVTTIFLLFAVMVFCTRGDEEDKPDESDESEKEKESEGEGEDKNKSENDDSSQEDGDGKKKPDCEQYKQQTCPRDGKPVCGTNNKKYDNECEMCLEMRKRKINVEILTDEEC